MHEHAAVGAASAADGHAGAVAPALPPAGDIKRRIDRSALSDAGKARANALFDRLAEAEAAVHNMPVEKVHLHEVGALDSIIDIVGAVFALEWFARRPHRGLADQRRQRHGEDRRTASIPVPAPATLRLLGDAPVYRRRRRRPSC